MAQDGILPGAAHSPVQTQDAPPCRHARRGILSGVEHLPELQPVATAAPEDSPCKGMK